MAQEGECGWAKGERTNYLTSLLKHAEQVETWNSLEECHEKCVELALA